MSRLVFNRNNGSADEYGHLLALNRLLTGDVIEGMQVQALASPAMSVIVGQGSCRISTGSYPSSYGYFGAIDTTTGSPAGESVTIGTAPTSNSRIDAVVAYVDTTITPSSGTANNPGMLKVVAVAGTVASSPSAPSNSTIQAAVGASNPYIKLANVLVGTNVIQINNGNVSDLRVWASISNKNISNPYGFRVYRNAAFSCTASTAVKIPFDTKLYDVGSNVDVTTNVGRFTATQAGKYHFNAATFFTSAGVVRGAIYLFKNGTVYSNGADQTPLSGNPFSTTVSDDIPLAVGDYVEVYAFCSVSNALTVGSASTYFSGSLGSNT
jgi:hypothetical protein